MEDLSRSSLYSLNLNRTLKHDSNIHIQFSKQWLRNAAWPYG